MLNRIMFIVVSIIIGIVVSTFICAIIGGQVEAYRHIIIFIYTLLVLIAAWFVTAPRVYTSEELYIDVCPLTCQYMGDCGCAIGNHSSSCPHRVRGGVSINDLC